MPKLPPRQSDRAKCEAALGVGAVCYDGGNALALGLLLDALTGLYLERAACEPSENGDTRDHDKRPNN